MKLSIVGTGYVGLITAVGFATHGHKITCIDIDKEKIDQINQGIPPIFEENLDPLLKENLPKIHATTNYETILDTEITFICVGTPSHPDGSIDLQYIKETTQKIAQILKNKPDRHLIVIKSTVIPGTTQEIIGPLLEKHTNKTIGDTIGLAMNPEFLREGVALNDFLNPDRIVIGTNDENSKKTLTTLYQDFNAPLIITSLAAAEMIKYASNAFLATKISYINEIGNLCKILNIDTYEVADGIGLDLRIGRAFLDSGIGWGGSCFPKDLDALIAWARTKQQKTYILDSVVTVNEEQPLKLITILQKHLPDLANKTIGILGLAFKPNTDDIRESRAIPIIKYLIGKNAIIKAYDPQAMKNFSNLFPTLHYCETATDTLDADAILILTKWDEFKDLKYHGKIVIDGRRLEEAQTAKIYEGVCW